MGAGRDNMSHSKGNISLNSDSHNESRQHLEKWDSVRGSLNEVMAEFGPFGPLSNVRYVKTPKGQLPTNAVSATAFT